MRYMVAIDLDIDRTDVKFFESKADAEKRYWKAYVAAYDGKRLQSKSGEAMCVLSCRLYEINAHDVQQARQLADAGEAKLLMDSNDELDIEIDFGDLTPSGTDTGTTPPSH